MTRDGYIREVSESGGNRTLYALTDTGRDALHSYRRLPPAFRHALRRIWSVDVPHPEAAAGPAPAPAPAAAEAALFAKPDASAPYPCPDARMALEKEPASGDLTLRLTGCPMGSFEHCPQCPIFQAVAGVRKVVFGG